MREMEGGGVRLVARAATSGSGGKLKLAIALLPECGVYVDALNGRLQDLAELVGLQRGIIQGSLGHEYSSPGAPCR